MYFRTGAIRDGRDFCSRNPLESKANSKIQFARRGPKTARTLHRDRVVCKSLKRNWLKHIHESRGAGCRLIPRGKCLREGLCLLSRHSRSCSSRRGRRSHAGINRACCRRGCNYQEHDSHSPVASGYAAYREHLYGQQRGRQFQLHPLFSSPVCGSFEFVPSPEHGGSKHPCWSDRWGRLQDIHAGAGAGRAVWSFCHVCKREHHRGQLRCCRFQSFPWRLGWGIQEIAMLAYAS